jgi:riboflavin kinase/FMN adenylyltransferase
MVSVDGSLVKGACSLGMNPTFEGGTRTIEVYLLDYAGQIYGREIALCFVQRLRDIQKYPDVSELVSAISRDVLHTREILAAVDLYKVTPVLGMVRNEIED